ncbi:MAG: sialidase family protein [Planctomycetaceae bacterium]
MASLRIPSQPQPPHPATGILVRVGCLWLIVTSGLAASEPPRRPQLHRLHHAIVTDTIPDAQSPCGLARDPVDGSLVLGFQDKGDVVAGTVTHFVRSHDGGQTWSPPFASYRHPDKSVGAAIGFTQLSPRQTVAVIMEITHTDVSVEGFRAPRQSRTLFARFDPHTAGVTPVSVLPQPPETLVGAMPQNLVTLRNGDLVLPAYLTPMDWARPTPGVDYGSGLFRSRDGGQTWSRFSRIFGPHPTQPEIFYNESVIFEKADGTLVAFARYDNETPPRNRRMGKVVSRDAGQTWSDTVDSDLPAICPAQLRLPGGGYLMFAGALDEPTPRTCMLYHSLDGETFTKLGQPFYSRTGGHPFNTATGGSQVLLPLGDDRFVLAFYAGDRDLPGRDKTYIDSNVVELR